MIEIAASFPRVRGYLDTPSYGLPSRATAAAVRRAVRDWERGELDPQALDAPLERMRTAFAALVGSHPDQVALAAAASQVVGMVAASLPDGARVLVAEGDFASVPLPFVHDPRLRVEVVPLARIIERTARGADLVAVSAVQSADGSVLDLDALAMAARVSGTRTLIDVTHAAGWMPLAARDFDVVVASGYKWLGTPRGIALAAVRPEAAWVRPVNASWCGADQPWQSLYGHEVALSARARRLDISPPWQLLEAGAVALELLAAEGPARIGHHSVGLANEFRARVGLPAGRSPIVALGGVDPLAFSRAGLTVAARGGRARLGFYVYNDERDVAAAAAAVRVAQAA